MTNQIILKKNREESVLRFHPWIFSGAISKITGNPKDGDDVEVFSDSGKYLAYGHYYSSSIAVKIYSFKKVENLSLLWKEKLTKAIHLRKDLGYFDHTGTNAFRIVNGEGDFIPGLIVDKYNKTLVIQCHSVGMYRNIDVFSSILKELIPDTISIYDKSTAVLKKIGENSLIDSFLYGNQAVNDITENNQKFYIDIVGGQKTGFFLDQRDNRKILSQYSNGKKVLNAYCYSGGFSIFALTGGASHVDSVDVSAKAIDLVNKNLLLNNISEKHHTSHVANVNEYLRDCGNYDVIILDPPAFAKHHAQKSQAIKGYRHINRLAINKLNKGGKLFTFSCSQAMDNELFLSTVISAAIESKRECRIIGKLSQPSDHPVNGFHLEGSYLKGLLLQID